MNNTSRNHALDVMRGLTIALMIIVNNPGDWKEMFVILKHAEWDGFLGADIVFPWFLFLAGYAAAMRLVPQLPHCASSLTLDALPENFYGKILRRATILFLIGMFLNAWPFGLLPGTSFDVTKLRVFGVLQRIAICTLLGGILLIRLRTKRSLIIGIFMLLALYEIGMRLGGDFTLENNFVRKLDTAILPTAMLYKVRGLAFDPEGLFSSFTATATFLIGGLAFRCKGHSIALATALLAAALILLPAEPINKNLWTLPYVFLTGGLGVAFLCTLEKIHTPRFLPLAAMGKNSLLLYVLSCIVGKTLAMYKVDTAMSIKQYLYGLLTAFSIPLKISSLLYSVILLALLICVGWLTRRMTLRI